MSAQYSESGAMKEVVVKFDSQENGYDILKPRYNGGVIGYKKVSVNSVGSMNV